MTRFLIIFLLIVCASCTQEPSSKRVTEDEGQKLLDISCDVEQVVNKELVSGNFIFGRANTRSDEASRSGKFSVKLNQDNPFGLSIEFKNLKKGNYLIVTAYRKYNEEKGSIIVSNSDASIYVDGARSLGEKDGWE